jgi:alkyl sulfatase BDS1-like metallo-beta-lactamase superfamily hydrolase
MFASHHWPRWGNARIQEILRAQRDVYAHLNNQVLHFANQGLTTEVLGAGQKSGMLPGALGPRRRAARTQPTGVFGRHVHLRRFNATVGDGRTA